MSFPSLLDEHVFDRELTRALKQSSQGLLAPEAARTTLLEMAALVQACPGPAAICGRRHVRPHPRYKDYEHRLASDVLVYTSPFRLGIIGVLA
jgi:hypothetical protein